MKDLKRLPLVFMVLAFIVMAPACSGRAEILPESEPGALQLTDETVLVQLDHSYMHGFPAGFFQEYALNNLGGQAVTVTLVPIDDSDLGLVIYRSDDTAVALIRVDDGAAGETERTHFTPEAGVNYLLRIYEMAGNTANYEITIGP